MEEEKKRKKVRRSLSPEARAAMSRGAARACAERWNGRGAGVRIYVDREAAEALETLPEKERRARASAALLFAAWFYHHGDAGQCGLNKPAAAAGRKAAKNV